MKIVIDSMTSATGWTNTAGTVVADNWPEFCASGNSTHLHITFTGAGVASKTFTAPISLSKSVGGMTVSADAVQMSMATQHSQPFKVRFWNGPSSVQEFRVTPTSLLSQYVFAVSLPSISRIDIEQYSGTVPVGLMVSDLIAYKDQMPLDAMVSIQAEIESNLETIQIGSVSCVAGATELTVSGIAYAERYSVLRIGSGATVETHKIDSDVSNETISFARDFDGQAMIYDHTGDPVYLVPQVLISPEGYIPAIPAIAISGYTSEPVEYDEAYSYTNDTESTAGTIRTRYRGAVRNHTFSIDADAHSNKLLDVLHRIIAKTFNQKTVLWINGRRCDCECNVINSLDFSDAGDLLGRLQCVINVFVGEESWMPSETQSTAPIVITKTVSPLTPVAVTL